MGRERRPRLSTRVRVVGVVAVVVVVTGAGVVWLARDGGPPETQRLGDVVVERVWTLDLQANETGEDTDGDTDDVVPTVEVEGDTVYVGHRGQLRAVEVATGEPRWQTDDVTGECCVEGAGVRVFDISGGLVAIAVIDPESGDAELALLDGQTGDTQWDGVAIDDDVVEVAIAGDVVVVVDHSAGGTPDGMSAFDAATGEPQWSQPQAVNDACWTGAALVAPWRDRTDRHARAQALATLSTDNGRPLQDRPLQDRPLQDRPVEDGDGETVHVPSLECSAGVVAAEAGTISSGDAQVSIYDAASLAPLGRVPRGESAQLAERSLVVEMLDEDGTGSQHHTLVGLDAATGQERWRYRTLAEYMNDDLRYGQVGDLVVVANDPGSDDGDERRFTELIDDGGEVLGELDDGIDEPAVLATGHTRDTVVIGDAHELVAFQITSD